MHISKIVLRNFRNFGSTQFVFSKGINTIIGENGSGKTNLFRAVRLLLDDNIHRGALRLGERDFFRGVGDWRGHWIIVSLEFDEISHDESIQALFLHGTGNVEGEHPLEKSTYNLIYRPRLEIRTRLSKLANGDQKGLSEIIDCVKIEDYEPILTGRSVGNFDCPDFYKSVVGDFDNVEFPEEMNPPEIGVRLPPVLSMPKEISFTFAQALRDVVSEFRNNRTNPLLALLRYKSSEINGEEFKPIVEQVEKLNDAIETLSDVEDVRNDIIETIGDTVGDAFSPNSLSVKSDLSKEAEQLFKSLKLFVGETDDDDEGSIHEMSLGGANLIFLTLKLLEFKYQARTEPIANFLFIEEPEAHLHTHIQKSLFEKINYENTQIIYSTHSSHISEACKIRNVNVIGKVDGLFKAFQPATGLETKQIRNVERYLDAVRSNLLFAKSVILVEGDAEEILIPILVKAVLGVSLDELGISLINIRSTGFMNVALLFHDDRISKKCSIVTDLDSSFIDTNTDCSDDDTTKNTKLAAIRSEKSGSDRQIRLDEYCKDNTWLTPFYAAHTFEVDLILCGNNALFVSSVPQVYSDASTAEIAQKELESNNISVSGTRVLAMANYMKKGWFAITLGEHVDNKTKIPEYIFDAIIFSHNQFSVSVIDNILKHCVSGIREQLDSDALILERTAKQTTNCNEQKSQLETNKQSLEKLVDSVSNYKQDDARFDEVVRLLESQFPDNPIGGFLQRVRSENIASRRSE